MPEELDKISETISGLQNSIEVIIEEIEEIYKLMKEGDDMDEIQDRIFQLKRSCETQIAGPLQDLQFQVEELINQAKREV